MQNKPENDRYQALWQNTLKLVATAANNDLKSTVRQKMDHSENWLFRHDEIMLDLLKTPLTTEVVDILTNFAERCGLTEKVNDLLGGATVNSTEKRSAHHTALRNLSPSSTSNNHAQQAKQTLDDVCELAENIRNGIWKGSTGLTIENVVNIGIGGSDLGPRMICTALKNNHAPRVHFVSNIDPSDLSQVLEVCEPESTLFIISSKSFGTLETLENAKAAKRWLAAIITEKELHRHLVAVSSNTEKASDFGIDKKNIFPMWDWIGGRYSLWSAIGLPIAISLGQEKFIELLDGAHSIDEHFSKTPLKNNIPVLLAFLDFIYVNVLNISSIAVLPYSDRLRLLPSYLQQLLMESNGKSVRNNGEPVLGNTSPIYWGSAGTVGQHSFHQLLHQGTPNIACEFVLPLNLPDSNSEENDKRSLYLIANCLAQSKALLDGKTAEQAERELIDSIADPAERKWLAKHKVVPGNRPNIIIAMKTLSAKNLGALIAIYEHRTFVQSVLWDINAFDQWGVELGKQLSEPIFNALISNDEYHVDAGTDQWVKIIKSSLIDNLE